jgi:hypothetical protein
VTAPKPDSAMSYIRRTYNVPACRGARVLFTTTAGSLMLGTITGAENAHLVVRFDDPRQGKHRLHPTWNVQYLVRMWRCTGCGKWSHAKRRPKLHQRGVHTGDTDYGEQWSTVDCGPFVEFQALSSERSSEDG